MRTLSSTTSRLQSVATQPSQLIARLQSWWVAFLGWLMQREATLQLASLSDRELQVLERLAEGKSNQQIAGELVVVPDTVKKHVAHILAKLAAANRTQAVARARALGLLR